MDKIVEHWYSLFMKGLRNKDASRESINLYHRLYRKKNLKKHRLYNKEYMRKWRKANE